MTEYVTYVPEDVTAELAVLLSLADHPGDVVTTTETPTLGVIIPVELAERFEKYMSLSESSTPEEPKRRGRPRKNPLPDESEGAA